MLTLFLGGDVMPGRGVDQILPHPSDPELREPYIRDAGTYVDLAEAAHGPIPRPVDPAWPWGEALRVLEETTPDVRVINLECSVTADGAFLPGKAVHYRMHPANLPFLTAARPDVCTLANNHVLDFGRRGLADTLDALAGAGLRTAGAGRNSAEAWRPAVVPRGDGRGRLLVLALALSSSGVPSGWAARADRGGVAHLPEASSAAAEEATGILRAARRPGDRAVVSVHWGSNWGYGVTPDDVAFAHALVDGGADVVHGHSSHHPRALEVYRERLVLYGCGDLVDDYEGITGHERYRDDLRLLPLVSLDEDTGELHGVRLVPLLARRMRLRHAPAADREWLHTVLDRTGREFGTRVEAGPDGAFALRWH